MQLDVRTLYRKLLTLYPRSFREELGESMEQTFHTSAMNRNINPLANSLCYRYLSKPQSESYRNIYTYS